MLKRQGVVRVTGDQCRYGLTASDGQKPSPARKSTSFMTNSPCIAQRLCLRCPNNREYKVHDHVILVNGRAKAAQVYPPALCRAICTGLREQLDADRQGSFLLANVDANGVNNTKQLVEEANQIKEKYRIVEEDQDEEWFGVAPIPLWLVSLVLSLLVYLVSLPPMSFKLFGQSRLKFLELPCHCIPRVWPHRLPLGVLRF